MIKFIKDNSYLIFKMMVNQLGMLMFGMVLSMATYNDDSLYLGTSVFSTLFYMALLYMMCWEYGAKEKVRVDHGRLKYVPLKGFYMSLCANVVNIIPTILLLVGYFGIADMAAKQPNWAYQLYDAMRLCVLFMQAMYIGIVNALSPHNPVAYILILLPAFAASAAGYFLGVKDIRLLGFLGLGKRGGSDGEDKN
jgi:ABC-type Na+ efflux pump permease subunit